MVPGLARPEKDGNGYEIVAGHRRTHGSELAGLEEPVHPDMSRAMELAGAKILTVPVDQDCLLYTSPLASFRTLYFFLWTHRSRY